MRVRVRLFARLKDIAGAAEMDREVPPGATARTVWNALAGEFPTLAPYAAISSCAVNEEYSTFDVELNEGDEVAFLPPVSGG